jgi:3-phytase
VETFRDATASLTRGASHLVLAPAALAIGLWPASAAAQTASVAAVVETDPVPGSGDAADDAAIWIHPTSRDLSTVIGTDKTSGIAVYALDGSQLQFLADGRLNNVDIRYDFPLGEERVALVAAGNRTDDTLALYAVDSDTRLLYDVAASAIPLTDSRSYGACMYRSPISGKHYFFGNSKAGAVGQWELFDDGGGNVDAVLVRSFEVGSKTEGCAADDEQAYLFIGEENIAVWRYGAEPDDGETRTQVDAVGAGNLEADIEGLTLYYAGGDAGYLLASSQGNSTYTVYERTPPHSHVLTFEIVAGASVDGVSGTDGIDVMNFGLGSAFPDGVFVAQDAINTGGNQNFKLVAWEEIAASASPALVVDPDHDPRGLTTEPPPAVPVSSPGGLLLLGVLLLGLGARWCRRP